MKVQKHECQHRDSGVCDSCMYMFKSWTDRRYLKVRFNVDSSTIKAVEDRVTTKVMEAISL